MARSFRNNLPLGEEHHSAKLYERLVREAREMYWVQGLSLRSIADLFHVPYSTLYDAVHYKTWTHVEDTFSASEMDQRLSDERRAHVKPRYLR